MFRPSAEGQVYCGLECYEAGAVKRVAKSVKRTNVVELKHRGAWAEMIAASWLVERGYEVFRNVSPHGPIDIVAIKGQVTEYIDVKLVSPEMLISDAKLGEGRVTKPRLKPPQVAAGIRPLFVSPDGFCSFSASEIEALYTTVFKAHLAANA
jgi:hypothetical protein